MGYSLIDSELNAWARNHGLQIFTKYKDADVRSTDVVASSGKKKCQIWVEPSSFFTFIINVWDYKKRTVQIRASKLNISAKLEEAYKMAESWLNA
jgi:hypothetical protein